MRTLIGREAANPVWDVTVMSPVAATPIFDIETAKAFVPKQATWWKSVVVVMAMMSGPGVLVARKVIVFTPIIKVDGAVLLDCTCTWTTVDVNGTLGVNDVMKQYKLFGAGGISTTGFAVPRIAFVVQSVRQ